MGSPILILTTHTGGGHLNLAQSLEQLLATRYDVAIVDPQPALVDGWYALVSRRFKKFLAWQYAVTDHETASFYLQRALTLSSRRRILDAIERVQPCLIITTHGHLSYATARAIERLPERIPLVFQLTDLGQVHMSWFSEKRADAYLAPTREIFAQALQQNIDKSRLHLTGRPVRRQFVEVASGARSATLASLGFDPATFTIFLQGGAKGSADVDRTIEMLLSSRLAAQIILAAGNNTRLPARYAGIERVRVLPFIERIAPYMAAADVIAGKAGASFITEAFMVEKPFLATTYISGQETSSLPFIERHNLGWVCLEPAAQRELLGSLISNPALIAEKADSIRTYKAWNMQANQTIQPTIEQLLVPDQKKSLDANL